MKKKKKKKTGEQEIEVGEEPCALGLMSGIDDKVIGKTTCYCGIVVVVVVDVTN